MSLTIIIIYLSVYNKHKSFLLFSIAHPFANKIAFMSGLMAFLIAQSYWHTRKSQEDPRNSLCLLKGIYNKL